MGTLNGYIRVLTHIAH